VFLTYQYGLRAKRQQHRRLEAILDGQRLLYNAALEERSQAWKAGFPRFKSRHRWLVRLQRIFRDPIDLWSFGLQRHARAAET
jgi:hypothetical protein